MKDKNQDILTNAPENYEIGVNTDMSNKHPLRAQKNVHGDSVKEHKNQEEANLFLNEGEIGQQRENN